MRKEIMYMGEQFLVDSDGTITWNNKVRHHYLNADGYPTVSFNTCKGWRTVCVHRLIALAFVPNPNNYPEVDHLNFDRTDFSIDNLSWITHANNVRRSVCNKPDINGANNPNFGNRKLSQFYKEHPEIAKEKQGRHGKQNGRYIDGRYMPKKV